MNISHETKNQLWWLIISVDYDYDRITIADHEINGQTLTIWLEDKYDFKNSLDDCLKLELPIQYMAKIIKLENLNSYEGTRLHPTENFEYKVRVQINEPIKWYNEDASAIEQQWAREAVVKQFLIDIIKNDTCIPQ